MEQTQKIANNPIQEQFWPKRKELNSFLFVL